jgi:hypothetical protein
MVLAWLCVRILVQAYHGPSLAVCTYLSRGMLYAKKGVMYLSLNLP